MRALDNPFYAALDKLLRGSGFDEFAEETCRECYAERMGQPGLPPGVYFRMLMVGYLEGIGSERGIAWRCRDSISLRELLGYGSGEDAAGRGVHSIGKSRSMAGIWIVSGPIWRDAEDQSWSEPPQSRGGDSQR